MLSYKNDVNLKTMIVEEMKSHQEHDQIIKGTYGRMNGVFKGCAVGCAVDSFNRKLDKKYAVDSHAAFENAIGVPEWLARVQDNIFEGLPDKENSQFAVDFLEAIPVGVNLKPVQWKFCAFILKENIERVLSLKIADDLKKQVVYAIRQVLTLHEDAIKSGDWKKSAARSAAECARSAADSAAESARSAWSAARPAAWSTAWSAAESAAECARSAAESAAESARPSAWSAARSAAWSAAWSARSAARSAAYQRYAKKLLKILKECN